MRRVMGIGSNSTLDDLKYYLAKVRAKEEVNTVTVIVICCVLAAITIVALTLIISKLKCMNDCDCYDDYEDYDDDFYFEEDDEDDQCCCGKNIATDSDFEA